ncbi:MAG: hypothetical protein ACTHLX_05245 [Candidatus Binatia bacterium]
MKHSAVTMMAFLTFGLATPVFAQNREFILAALTKLAPAEREARIVEGAKKENGLVWYSSTTAEDALALIKKFHEHWKVGAAITSTGANVYSSALFYDFLLSRAGMETIRASRRIPTRPDVTAPYLKPYKLLPFDPQVMDEFDRYVALFRDTFKPAQ